MTTDQLPPEPGPAPGSTPPPGAPFGTPPGPTPGAGPAGGPAGGPSGGPGGPAGSGGAGGRHSMDGFFDSVRRTGLSRSDDRWVGGVAAGVADRFGIDPLLVRGLLFLSVFVSGAGLVLYALAWALLPERSDGRIHLQQAVRGDFDVAMLGAVAAFVVGLSWSGGWWSWWDHVGLGWLDGFFWLAAVVVVAVLVVKAFSSRRPVPPRAPGAPYGAAPTPPRAPGAPGASAWGTAPGAPVPPVAPSPAVRPTASFPAAAAAVPPVGTTAPVRPAPGVPPVPGPAGPGFSGPAPAAPAPSRGPVPPTTPLAGPAAPAGFSGSAVPPGPPVPPVPPGRHQRPPKPPKPPRAPRRGPGAATLGVVVGVSLLAGAVLLLADRAGDLPTPFWPTWLGVALGIVGLGIVVSGLRGRSSGTLGFFAIVGLVIALPVATTDDPGGFVRFEDGTVLTEGRTVVRSVEQAQDGFAVRWGDPVIDLSELDLPPASDDPVVVPISLGAGQTTVVVPEDAAVEAHVRVGAGTARWEVDGRSSAVSGVLSGTQELRSAEVGPDGEAQLLLDVRVGAGQIIITEDS